MTDKEHIQHQADQLRLMGKKYVKSMTENKKLNMHLNRGVALVDGMTLQIDELRQENEQLKEQVRVYEMKYDNTGSIMNRSHQIKRIEELQDKLKKIEALVNSERVGHQVKFDLQIMFREGAE
ncbi:hypothetical protein [Sporosarcina jiandibaonis]|uniref:hypothetical protein n=1 Tax=Sporosarcina jiandibaonis TaxID=2715535 RepID=UPI0015554C5B|nr:hypothetical protein [Sporosarcina jiandibaonis]